MNEVSSIDPASVKQCECCGTSFQRYKHDNPARWEKRRFCCRRCFAIAREDRKEHMVRLHARRSELLKDPAYREANAEKARANRAKGRELAGAARTEQAMGWCPVAYRPLYRELTLRKRMKAADARVLVEDTIAHDAARKAREEADAGLMVARAAKAMADRHAREVASRY